MSARSKNRLAVAVLLAASALAALGAFAGCEKLGDEATEDAQIVAMSFVPSTSGSGFTTDGKMAFIQTDAKYAVTLRCQHGNFAIEGDDESAAHILWREGYVGKLLRVHYRPKVAAGGPHDGEVIGFKFLYADELKGGRP